MKYYPTWHLDNNYSDWAACSKKGYGYKLVCETNI
jgi:hypothetical protein